MTTDEDRNAIAEAAYGVDRLRENSPLQAGSTFFTSKDPTKQEWRVTEVSANVTTGFQAMAVAPIINGVVDESQIYIAFAGTNFDDRHDVGADIGVVIATRSAQAEEALEFAKLVEARHPGATFVTVGHSLGGYQALYVAAEKRWPSTTFNAPDPWRIMSPATQAWLTEQNAAGLNPLTNYVNMFDVVGNAKGNRSGAAVFVEDVPHRPLADYHNLFDGTGIHSGYTFDSAGNIAGTGAAEVDFGVILYNAGQTSAARTIWALDTSSPYPKVLVAMEPALALADDIEGISEQLKAIRTANKKLESRMQSELNDAMREYTLFHPQVSAADVENCVAAHALGVHQNLDHEAVESVNRLIARQLATVEALHTGIRATVVNAMTQDARSAAAFAGH